jgi:hypothetical protein
MSSSGETATTKAVLTKAILNVCTDDWFGLWEIRDEAAAALHCKPDAALLEALRDQLAQMMGAGLLLASLWSTGPPQPLSADDVRNLPVDSVLWESPGITDVDEQIRVTSTEAGHQVYFGTA